MREDLSKFSGEEYYQKPPQLVLNEITINGKTGNYRMRNVIGGLKEVTKGKQTVRKYEEKDLGSKIELVFLKIRRRLSHYKKGERSLMTSEHNYKGDFVTLWGDTVEKGTAEELRTAHPELRTQQIVYAIYNKELVRVIVKGSSLGSQDKAENVPTFYDYISSFKKDKDGNKIDEHFYQYNTVLTSIEESSDLGPYFAINFNRGEKLSEEMMDIVEQDMKRVHNYCLAVDEYYSKAQAKDEVAKGVIEEALDVIDYGSDEPSFEEPKPEAKEKEEEKIDEVPF